MKKNTFVEANKVLIFNSNRVLVAITRSLRTAAQLIDGNVQSISFCCNGDYITTKGWYFRKMHPDHEVELKDLDKLKLEDYDNACGIVRRYLPKPDKARKAKQKKNN